MGERSCKNRRTGRIKGGVIMLIRYEDYTTDYFRGEILNDKED